MAFDKIPENVEGRFKEWTSDGCPVQYSSPIDKEKWAPGSIRLEEFLSRCPIVNCSDGKIRTMISREDALSFSATSLDSPEGMLDVHILAFMWGKGLNGLGPTHLSESLATSPKASGDFIGLSVSERLLEVKRVLDTKGIIACFNLFATSKSECKLDRCGPSFATKDMFFFSANSDYYPALILDSYVVEFFSQLGVELDSNSSHSYGQYLYTMYSWAVDLELSPSQMEVVVFGWKLEQLHPNSQRNWYPCYKSTEVEVSNSPKTNHFEVSILNGRTVATKFDHYWSCEIEVRNGLDKEVRAFAGSLLCADVFGSPILGLDLRADSIDLIPSGAKSTINWRWLFNQFSNDFRWLENRRFQDMVWTFKPKIIIFTDGTRRDFG
jgi:hypothetical protein